MLSVGKIFDSLHLVSCDQTDACCMDLKFMDLLQNVLEIAAQHFHVD